MKKKPSKPPVELIPPERIENSILLIRGQKVLLDFDLADLYDVETRTLVQSVKRNIERFPDDFMFQLTSEEFENWRSQFVISNPGAKKGLRRPPYAFTEQGVAMLSSVLRSPRAVEVNIQIMRAFVRLRELMETHKAIAAKLTDIEARLDGHDHSFQAVFETIRQLLQPPTPEQKKRRIGFRMPNETDTD
jgi:ORF6N domain